VKRAYLVNAGIGNCGDNSNWLSETIDTSIFPIGLYPSLDIDSAGLAHIAYYDQFNEALKYAYYGGIGDCVQDGSWICFLIDNPDDANVGLFPSLHAPQGENDTLRIAYYDSTNGHLKYAFRRDDNQGNCYPGHTFQCRVIDEMGRNLPWAGISLDVDSNLSPLIAYTDASEDLAPLALKVAEPAYGQPYANCSGEILYDWWCATLNSSGNQYIDEGRYVSLGIRPNGQAMIAYSEEDTYEAPGDYNLKLTYQITRVFLPVTIK
jgi:hypothetical protein